MRTRAPWCALVMAAAITAGVTGCGHPAGTGARGTAAPVPGATTSAGGGHTSPAPSAAATHAPGTPVCRASHLKVAMIYGGPAAGTVGGVIGFTNDGSITCHLAGWPAVVGLSAAGNRRAGHTLNVFGAATLHAPPVVPLRPGARAVAVLAVGDQPGPGMTACPPPYRRLRVSPPASTHASVIPAWIHGLGAYLPACTRLLVSPVVPEAAVPYLRLHHV